MKAKLVAFQNALAINLLQICPFVLTVVPIDTVAIKIAFVGFLFGRSLRKLRELESEEERNRLRELELELERAAQPKPWRPKPKKKRHKKKDDW